MSMTQLEALDRAKRIWGEQVVITRGYGDSECFVYDPQGVGTNHSMDGNGHAVCHPSCSDLEEKAYPNPTGSLGDILPRMHDAIAASRGRRRQGASKLLVEIEYHERIEDVPTNVLMAIARVRGVVSCVVVEPNETTRTYSS